MVFSGMTSEFSEFCVLKTLCYTFILKASDRLIFFKLKPDARGAKPTVLLELPLLSLL